MYRKVQVDLKAYYRDHKTKRDEYLLSKANLAQDTGEEDKANAIPKYQEGRTLESMLSEFSFPSRDKDISTRNQSNTNPEVMEKYGGIRRRC